MYSRVGLVILGSAESTMPWIYCYLPMILIWSYNAFVALNLKKIMQVVKSMEESALTDVSSDQLLPG